MAGKLRTGLLRLLKAPKLNKIYNTLDQKHGIDMIDEALRALNINVEYDLAALEAAIPDEGPFVTVSNHPFGFLDGVILLMLML